jgi:hypothetical protein
LPDKANFKRKNEFGSFANANFNGGMYAQCWTMIDKPESIQKLEAYEPEPETYWKHSMESSPVLRRI